MVCRTRLRTNRADLLLSIPGAVVSALKGGGEGLTRLGEHLPGLRGPTSTLPPPLRVNRRPGCRKCTVMARDQGGLESGVVWAARPRHPHGHLPPARQYRRQHPTQ